MGTLPVFEVVKEGHGRTVVDQRCWDSYKNRGFTPLPGQDLPKGVLKGKELKAYEEASKGVKLEEQKAEQAEKAEQAKAKKLAEKNAPEPSPEDESGSQETSGGSGTSQEPKSRADELIETVLTLKDNKQLAEFCDDNKVEVDLSAYNTLRKERIPAVIDWIRENVKDEE